MAASSTRRSTRRLDAGGHENLGTAPIERILMHYPGVVEVAVYSIPDPSVGTA